MDNTTMYMSITSNGLFEFVPKPGQLLKKVLINVDVDPNVDRCICPICERAVP